MLRGSKFDNISIFHLVRRVRGRLTHMHGDGTFAWSQAKRQLTVPVIPNDGLFSRNRHINTYHIYMSHMPPQCLFPLADQNSLN